MFNNLLSLAIVSIILVQNSESTYIESGSGESGSSNSDSYDSGNDVHSALDNNALDYFDDTTIEGIIEKYNYLLNNSHSVLNNNINEKSHNPVLNCSYQTACLENITYNDYMNDVAVNLQHSLVKQINFDTSLASFNHEICPVLEIDYLWKENHRKNEKLTWQYYGNNDIFMIYPSFNWSQVDECPGTYNPEDRPWYISATTGQKNIIIAIDISTDVNSQSIRNEIDFAIKIVDGLTFYDYVLVFTYDSVVNDDFVEWDNNILIQATNENKQTIIDALKKYRSKMSDVASSMKRYESNIYDVMKYINDVYVRSEEDYQSSYCHNITMFLTGTRTRTQTGNGNDKYDRYHNYDVMFDKDESNQFIFTFMSGSGKDDSYNQETYELLPCLTGGKFYKFDNDNISIVFHNFNKLLSTHTTINNVRYSQVYDDAFGLGQMITGALPIYNNTESNNQTVIQGVSGIDIVLDNFGKDEVNSYLLKNQHCEELTLRTGTNTDTDTCKRLEQNKLDAESKPKFVKDQKLVKGLTIAFPLLTIIVIMCIVFNGNNFDLNIYWFAILICFIWLTAEYWETMNDTHIKKMYWKRTNIETIDYNIIDSECTRKVNCGCSEYNGISCSDASRQLLSPGSLSWSQDCNNGFHCCKTNTYCGAYSYYTSCSGGKYSTCTTHMYCSMWITECVRSVNRRKCTMVRGICQKITVNVKYNTEDGQEGYLNHVKNCGLNETICTQDYLNEYLPIGRVQSKYYNPWNPTEIQSDLSYSGRSIVSISLAATFMILALIGFIIEDSLFIVNCSGSSSGSSSRSNHWSNNNDLRFSSYKMSENRNNYNNYNNYGQNGMQYYYSPNSVRSYTTSC